MKKEDIKSLYSVSIENLVEKEVKKEKEEDGKKVTYLEMVEENQPIEVFFKKPTRRQIEESEEVYSIEMSRCLNKGIMSRASMAKHYREVGGVLTEEEESKRDELFVELAKAKNDLSHQMTLKRRNKKKEEDLVKKISNAEREIRNIEIPFQQLFDNCAESKAQDKSIKYFLLNCACYAEKEGADLKDLFEGDNRKEKEDFYYSVFEDEGKQHKAFEAVGEIATAAAIWYMTKNDDIESTLKQLQEQELLEESEESEESE